MADIVTDTFVILPACFLFWAFTHALRSQQIKEQSLKMQREALELQKRAAAAADTPKE